MYLLPEQISKPCRNIDKTLVHSVYKLINKQNMLFNDYYIDY